ncbi:hypothetical protein OAN04_02100 [Candidatus Pelagibacter ubique]|nr:hypothetical protein [Candidatus Pelagibacter ubique]
MKNFLLTICITLLFFNTSHSKETRIVNESVLEDAWKIAGRFIIPECFDHIRNSGDWYETYYDKYFERLKNGHWQNPNFIKFTEEVGNYLNKEIPLNDIVYTGWESEPQISLTKQLDGCISKEPETSISSTNEFGIPSSSTYRVVHNYKLSMASELAPHIDQEFESIKEVEITNWFGGSMGPKTHTVVFGLLWLEEKPVLLPLRNKSMLAKVDKTESTETTSYFDGIDWFINQREFKTPQQLILKDDEKRFVKLIISQTPDMPVSWEDGKYNLREELIESILFQGNIKYLNNDEQVVVSGCMYKYCSQKGFIYIYKDNFIGLIRHKNKDYSGSDFFIYSKKHNDIVDLPMSFFKAVEQWIEEESLDYDINPNVVRFVGSNNEIKETKNIFASNNKPEQKLFTSSVAGLSFSLTNDWEMDDKVTIKDVAESATADEKKFFEFILEKTKIKDVEILFRREFKPDVIAITKIKMPRKFRITEANAGKNCREIIRVNEKNIGKKGTLYDCKYIENKLSKREGALFISYKDDLAGEKGVVVNEIIHIINSRAIYFSTSCKKYCKEVTNSLFKISETLTE